jgi:hypothetical protein
MIDPNYECATCGTHDRNRYARCDHPACPDGHDQPDRFGRGYVYPDRPTPEAKGRSKTLTIILLAALCAFLFMCQVRNVRAMEHGWDHSNAVVKWFDNLKMPDSRKVGCCGKGEAYEADTYILEPGKNHCEAIITEGSARRFPDGMYRPEIKNGTKFAFPCSKVNPPEDGNPTGHAQIFIGTNASEWDLEPVPLGDNGGTVYCFVPLPNGS